MEYRLASALISEASAQHRREEMPEQIALTEPSVPVFEKVEWSGTGSVNSRRHNQRYARFQRTSWQNCRSDRMPKA